jgi:hypothetical protein
MDECRLPILGGMPLGNDHTRRLLLGGLMLGLVARLTIFSGGGIGGVVSVAVFWLFAIGLVVFAIRQFALRRRLGSSVPILKWSLILVALLAWTFAVFGGEDTPVHNLMNATLLICIVVLIGLAIKDLVVSLFGGRSGDDAQSGDGLAA